MRLGSVLGKDNFWTGIVSRAVPVANGFAAFAVLLVSNRIANRTRDNAWTLGDQAINKYGYVTTSVNPRSYSQ